MKMVYEAGNIIDAHLVRHALEHAGIPAFVRGEALLGGMGELPVCGMVAVCVPESCWPEACDVVRALPFVATAPEAGALAADDESIELPVDLGLRPVGAA